MLSSLMSGSCSCGVRNEVIKLPKLFVYGDVHFCSFTDSECIIRVIEARRVELELLLVCRL